MLKRCGKVGLYLSILIVLVVTSFPLSPNISNADELTSNELLDVGFGGSFSSEIGYTNSTGETMDGTLSRRTGKEKIEGSNVQLNGNSDGIDFKPRISLGSDTLDESFIVEAEFRPDSNPQHYSTLLSIGGNKCVRYISL